MAIRDAVFDPLSRLDIPCDGTEAQHGLAFEAIKDAEAVLAQQLSASAKFDRQILDALWHAHATTVDGGRRLDALEIEVADAARVWDLSTASGAREFQRFLIGKLGEIITVVDEANDDDAAKAALASAVTGLYASQPDELGGRADEPTGSTTPSPLAVVPVTDADSDESSSGLGTDPYLDALPPEELDAGTPTPEARGSTGAASALPQLPSWGTPGLGAMSGGMPGAMPTGMPLAGLLSGLRGDDGGAAEQYPQDATPPADEAASQRTDTEDHDDDAGQLSSQVAVRLPDGSTTTVSDPRLAAAMQSAAQGVPVADAFRRQGIEIPPAGTPVAEPLDAAKLRPGDIGVFTDRHALAVGDGKALLDGQLQLVSNLRGPGFLGWLHAPLGTREPAPTAEPTPTRPAMVEASQPGVQLPVPAVIVD